MSTREHERDERERFSKCKRTDDRRRPHFMGLHEFNNVLGDAVNLILGRHGPTGDKEMRRLVPSFETGVGTPSRSRNVRLSSETHRESRGAGPAAGPMLSKKSAASR
jgi:hypothetical protein